MPPLNTNILLGTPSVSLNLDLMDWLVVGGIIVVVISAVKLRLYLQKRKDHNTNEDHKDDHEVNAQKYRLKKSPSSI